MSCRSAEDVDAEMQRLYAEARKVEWMYEPTFRPRWYPGFPERLMFATLTCAPWTWVLVAPFEGRAARVRQRADGRNSPRCLVTGFDWVDGSMQTHVGGILDADHSD